MAYSVGSIMPHLLPTHLIRYLHSNLNNVCFEVFATSLSLYMQSLRFNVTPFE